MKCPKREQQKGGNGGKRSTVRHETMKAFQEHFVLKIINGKTNTVME